MGKIVVSILNKEEIKKTYHMVDTYLLGVEGFSVNMPYVVKKEELEEIISLIHSFKKNVWLNLNKNMFEKDLVSLSNLLLKVDGKVEGICFYDVSIPSFYQTLKLKTPLIWHQEHFTTNYETINFWEEHGASYTFLSNEITKEEVGEIKEHTKAKLILQVFGYIPIFLSKRPLLTNYKKVFDIKEDGKYHYLKKEGECYPIIEYKSHVEVYTSKIRYAKDIDMDYIYLNHMFIEENDFMEIIEAYYKNDFTKTDKKYKEEKDFLENKTVYRVKDL